MTRPKSSGRCPCHASPADIRKYRSVDGRRRGGTVRVWPEKYQPRPSRAKEDKPIPAENWEITERWMRKNCDGGYYEFVCGAVNDALAHSGMYPTDAREGGSDLKTFIVHMQQRDRFERRADELRRDVWLHIARKCHLYQNHWLKCGPMAWLKVTVARFCKDQFKGEKTWQNRFESTGEDNEHEELSLHRSSSFQTCDFFDPELAEIYLDAVNWVPVMKTTPPGHSPDVDADGE